MNAYECVIKKIITAQGAILAVGGICRPGTAIYWEKRFDLLQDFAIDHRDIYGIDHYLAQRLQALAQPSLVLVGAACRLGLPLRQEGRTGGVLGRPENNIASAQGQAEALPEGFAMYTAPGGPGLVALATPRQVQELGEALAVQISLGAPDQELAGLLEAANLPCYLAVNDGTGAEARGFAAAGSCNGHKFCSLSGETP